jgi:F0F1-type ATP synthase assembly protein I
LPPRSGIVRYGRYGALAFEFTGTIAGGAVLGWLVDEWLGTEPVGVLVGIIVAVIGGFIRMIEVLRRFDRVDRQSSE